MGVSRDIVMVISNTIIANNSVPAPPVPPPPPPNTIVTINILNKMIRYNTSKSNLPCTPFSYSMLYLSHISVG